MNETLHKETILEHYRKQASEHGLESTSTMLDQTTREIEVSSILSCISYVRERESQLRLLEIGCGNGYLLKELRNQFCDIQLTGIDYSPDMIALAQQRRIENCEVYQGDVRSPDLEPSRFDVVVSERCLINVLEREAQDEGLRNVHRVLRPGGYAVIIEAFMDGLQNLNKARTELGLDENTVPHHNLWFDKPHFLKIVSELFDVLTDEELHSEGLPKSNFLSSHYFISRVFYPCITKREILYNTEFIRFFRFLPPTGNYAPIQLFLVRKPI